RGIALAAGKPAIGLTTLAAFAAPHIAEDDTLPVVAAIDARHNNVYLQVFGPRGRTVVAPKVASLREAVRAAQTNPARIVRSAAPRAAGGGAPSPRPRPPPLRPAAPAHHPRARGPRPGRGGGDGPPKPLFSARPRGNPRGRAPPVPPMIGFLTRLLARGEPALS